MYITANVPITEMGSARLRECSFLFFGVMARVFGDEFAPYLAQVVPPLLASCKQAEQGEDKLELERAAGEISGEPTRHNGLAVLLHALKRLDGVLVFLFGLGLPLLDGGQALDRAAFISHDGLVGEALNQDFRVFAVLRGHVSGNRLGKIDGHGTSPAFRAGSATGCLC